METVVRTTYHSPTDYKGSRFTVKDMRHNGVRKTVSYDHSANNARQAAIVEVMGDDISLTFGWEDSRHVYYLVNGKWDADYYA